MHPNPLLDPLLWVHVVASQRQLLATRLRDTEVSRSAWRVCARQRGADGGGNAGSEPEAAHTPEKLRAA
jgi:hypothetical protein